MALSESILLQESLHDLRRRLTSLTPAQNLRSSTQADLQNAAEQEKKFILEEFMKKLTQLENLEPFVVCGCVQQYGTEAQTLIDQCLARIGQEEDNDMATSSPPSSSSSSPQNEMLTEAIQEFRGRVQSLIPLDLGHLTVHDHAKIEEVTKETKINIWKEFMERFMDAENSEEEKVCGFIKGFNPRIREVIEEYKTKNQENRNQYDFLMQERIDKLCSYLKTSLEEKLLLSPEMDVTVLESNIENGKLKALEHFSNWDYGNLKLYEEKVKTLKEKMNELKMEMLEKQIRHSIGTSTSATENAEPVQPEPDDGSDEDNRVEGEVEGAGEISDGASGFGEVECMNDNAIPMAMAMMTISPDGSNSGEMVHGEVEVVGEGSGAGCEYDVAAIGLGTMPMSGANNAEVVIHSEGYNIHQQLNSSGPSYSRSSVAPSVKKNRPESKIQMKTAVIRLVRCDEGNNLVASSSTKIVNDSSRSSQPESELRSSGSFSQGQSATSMRSVLQKKNQGQLSTASRNETCESYCSDFESNENIQSSGGDRGTRMESRRMTPPLERLKARAFRTKTTTKITATPKPSNLKSFGGKRLFLDANDDDDDDIQVIAEIPSKVPRIITPKAVSTTPATKTNEREIPLIFRLSSNFIAIGTQIVESFQNLNEITPVIGLDVNHCILSGVDALQCQDYWSLSDFLRERSSLPSTISFKIGEDMVKHNLTLEFLLGILLMTMKLSAESRLKKPFSSAIITVPLWLSSVHRIQIKHACEIAGFFEVRLVNQETIGAYAYCSRPVRRELGRNDIFVLSENFGIVSAIEYRYCRRSRTLTMIQDEFFREDLEGNMEAVERKNAVLKLFGRDNEPKTVIILAEASSKWRESFQEVSSQLGYGYEYDDSIKEDDLFGASVLLGKMSSEEYLPFRLSISRECAGSRGSGDYYKFGQKFSKAKLPRSFMGELPKTLLAKTNNHPILQENLLTGGMIKLGELEVDESKIRRSLERNSCALIVSFHVGVDGIVSLEHVRFNRKDGPSKTIPWRDYAWTCGNKLSEGEIEDAKGVVQHILKKTQIT